MHVTERDPPTSLREIEIREQRIASRVRDQRGIAIVNGVLAWVVLTFVPFGLNFWFAKFYSSILFGLGAATKWIGADRSKKQLIELANWREQLERGSVLPPPERDGDLVAGPAEWAPANCRAILGKGEQPVAG